MTKFNLLLSSNFDSIGYDEYEYIFAILEIIVE